MGKTKIICTIGPASEQTEVLEQLMQHGMNVSRLNFSHGNHEEHGMRMRNIKQAAQNQGVNVGILLDTKGPEIRIGTIESGKVTLREGEQFVLTTQEVEGNAQRVCVSYADLPTDVQPGCRILIDDGLIGLEVQEINGPEIVCQITNGGELGSRKGVNVPGVDVQLPAVTQKDREDILFGLSHGIDFIAASFVRKAADVLEIRRILEEQNAHVQIISKIENHQGVINIDEILKVSDGIMVARGDLGVEIPTEEVPLVQKMIIEKCNKAGKPVITATQMLDSMMRNPRPTRAEASDVANAIFDGTDGIMLSGETAAGKYPIEAVQTMAKIAERAERALRYEELLERKRAGHTRTVTDAISHATCTTAQDLGARAIITSTKSGHTARMVSKYRPRAPIVAVTPRVDVARKLMLVWGVYPLLVPETQGTDEMIDIAVAHTLQAGYIQSGDLVVITAGVPVGIPGTTNLLKVHIVGDVLAKGTGIGARSVTGPMRVVGSAHDALSKVQPGDILVTTSTDRDLLPAMEKAAGIITEEGGLTSHAAIVALHLGIPVVVGVEGATSLLEDGAVVTIDGTRGVIYRGTIKVL